LMRRQRSASTPRSAPGWRSPPAPPPPAARVPASRARWR
jgi:hypothetical protein